MIKMGKTKRMLRRSFALAMSVAMSLSAPGLCVMANEAPQGQEASPFIKADGKNLRTDYGQGDIINLRGTNAGGYLLQEFWMTPSGESAEVYDQSTILRNLTERFGDEAAKELVDIYEQSYWKEEDFENCAGMGMNCIRLPFWWRNLVDENGNFYGYDERLDDPYAKAFERLDWFVEMCEKYGLYVVLDMHGAPGSQNGSDHSGVDGKDTKEASSEFFFGENAQANQELYLKLWRVIAARYEGNPTVAGYDLLNEPYCTYRYNSSKSADELHSILWDIYDKAYNVIRDEDPDHVVIMEATWNPEDLPNPDSYGWENIMYEYHNYLYDDYDNLGGGQILNMENKTNAIGNADYNVPSYMGEFNYFNNLEAWDEGLELLTEYGINWTTWTYKTITGYGNWGLYHHPEYMDNGLDISTADYEQIKELWSKVDTATGSTNSGLIDVVSKWCRAETFENSTRPVTAEPESEFLSGWQKLETEDEAVCKVTGGVIEEQDFYSGGKAAGNMNTDILPENVSEDWSNVNYLTFTIKAADKGTYPIVMHYNGDDDKEILVKVGDKEAKTLSVPRQADGTWNRMHDVLYFADLEKGENTVKISGALGSGWMNIDYIATTNHFVTVKEDKTLRLEGEFFYTNAGLEGQTFFSAGKAVGNLNNNISFDEIADDWSNMKYVDFTVFAEKEGDYRFTWHWNGNGQDGMTAVYRLNDGENVALLLDNAGASWNEMNSSDFVVHLNKGFNDFKLSGTIINQDNWANIDCIDVINTEDMEEPDGYPESYSGFVRVKKDNVTVSEDGSNISAAVNADYDGKYRYFVGYVKEADEPVFRTELGSTELTEGENNISISLMPGEGEKFAFLDVARTPVTVAEDTNAERYEAEDYKCKSANNPPAEHQSFYSGRSENNGVGGMGATVASFNVGDDIIAKKLNYTDFAVFAEKEGEYKVTVAANGNGTNMTAVYQLNGQESISFELPNEGYGWDHMIYATFNVELNKGMNRLVLGGTWTGDWLNYDYIDVAAVDDAQQEEPADPTEPEDPEVPENPEDPEQPENPDTPENPQNPTDPEQPTDPTTPADPVEPEEPEPPLHRHTIVTKVIQPTFSREGSVKQVCSECGEVISERVLPKLTPKVVAVAVYKAVVTVIRWFCKLFG